MSHKRPVLIAMAHRKGLHKGCRLSRTFLHRVMPWKCRREFFVLCCNKQITIYTWFSVLVIKPGLWQWNKVDVLKLGSSLALLYNHPGIPVCYAVHVQEIPRSSTPLRWSLLLIAMMSLSIHMMTRQGHICVQCVTSVLRAQNVWITTNEHTPSHLCVQYVRNRLVLAEDWMNTKDYTLEEIYIHAFSVRNSLLVSVTWDNIWMFTAINTSALNVESVL